MSQQDHWTKWLPGFAAWAVLTIALTTTDSARAAFDVPNSCRAGSGTYTGQLDGTCSYQVCVINGQPRIKLQFDGRFAEEYSFDGTPAVVYEEVPISDSGAIDHESDLNTVLAAEHVRIVAQFGNCGLEGTWELTDDNGENFSGTFTMSGTGPGEACDSGGSANPGASTTLCGSFGTSGMAMLIAVAVCLQTGKRRLRRPG